MIGDPYYDKTVLILNGDSFTDLSIKKNKVVPVGGAVIDVGAYTGITPTGSAIHCGNPEPPSVAYNGYALNSVYVHGETLDHVGYGDCTIEMCVQIYETRSFPMEQAVLLGWGVQDFAYGLLNGFSIMGGYQRLEVWSNTGNTPSMSVFTGSPSEFDRVWINLTIIKSGTTIKFYLGTTLIQTFTNAGGFNWENTSHNGLTIGEGSRSGGAIYYGSATSAAYSLYGTDMYLGCLRLTKAARPAPTSATFSTFPTYAGQITGTITGVVVGQSWTVRGTSTTGLTCSTVTTSGAYTLNCPSLEPYTLTAERTVNGSWKASTAVALDYYVVPTNPDANPIIYKCTTAGTTGSSQPAFSATTITDGTVVWTKQQAIVDPSSLGIKIPS